MPLNSNLDDGLILDSFFSGAQVNFGSKLKVMLEAGRWNLDNANRGIKRGLEKLPDNEDKAASYQGVELNYSSGKLVRAGVGYRHFSSDVFKSAEQYNTTGVLEDTADIWSVGGKYVFDKNVALSGGYAKNTKADKLDQSAIVQFNYKGTKDSDMGSWGATLAYRHVAANSALAPTYFTDQVGSFTRYGSKGFELGVGYVPFKNVRTQLQYFNGKELMTDNKVQTLYGRVSFFF